MDNLIKGLSAVSDTVWYIIGNGLTLGVPAFTLLKAVQYVVKES